ncbi:MAG TPA: alpha/beta hydrolase-fold protein, partial [Candidatus Acidoferrum sp.]|nr:alpha/beta hydrolase-fold protein [Candidatus Acidoferrum sp.]
RPNQAQGFMYPRQASLTSGTQYTITGPITGKSLTFHLFLPASYNPADRGRTYPVIYGFHGKGSTSTAFNTAVTPRLVDAINAAQIPESILVMPSIGDFWYADAFDFSTPRETQIIKELIPHIDAHTLSGGARKRLITGFSMGCFGSMRLAFKYPEMFRGIASYAGPNMDADSNNSWGTSDAGDFANVWNSSQAALRPASPCATTGNNGLAETYQVKLQSMNYPIRIGKSAADNVSLASMNNFDSRLTSLGITHTFVDLATPTHNISLYYTADAGAGFAFLAGTL